MMQRLNASKFLMATTELNNGSAQWTELQSIKKGGINMSATASAVTCTSYSVWDTSSPKITLSHETRAHTLAKGRTAIRYV
jgi:hypothetical protein